MRSAVRALVVLLFAHGPMPLAAAEEPAKPGLDMRASELIGKRVVTPPGGELGKVKDILVDTHSGGMQFVLIGSRTYRLSALSAAPARDRMVLGAGSQSMETSALRRIYASELIGKRVQDRAGGHAGEIEDLVVSLGDGRLRYIVLELDRASSPGARTTALPPHAFAVHAERGRDVLLKIDRARLSPGD